MVWIKENWFKIFTVVIMLIITGILGYYYLSYIPTQDRLAREKAENEKQEQLRLDEDLKKKEEDLRKSELEKKDKEEVEIKKSRETARSNCLTKASEVYEDEKDANTKYRTDGTSYIPVGLLEIIDKHYKDAKDDCVKLYPI
jgi:hypothetical protein